MAIVYRSTKGSRLTVSEIDGNFEHLSDEVNTKVDSSEVRNIVDSDYVQSRQLTFDFMDSSEVIALIDSSYINARVNLANSLDSSEALDLIEDKLGNLSYSIIPDSNEAYDLGSSTRRFRDLYLSGSTLNLGGVSLKKDSDNAFSIGTDLVGGEAIAAGWWDTQWFKVGPKTGGAELKVRIDDVPSDFENQEWIKFLRNIQSGDTITIETPTRQVITATTTVTEDHFTSTKFRFYFGVDTAPDIAGNDTYVYRISKTLTPTNNIRIKYSATDDADWGGTSPTNVSAALDKLAENSTGYMDSSEVATLVDSDYVQARQDYSYSELIGAPTSVSEFTNDANYVDSDGTKAIVDSAYIQARQITYSFDSDIQNLTTSILPTTNESVDLGSDTKRFRDLYLSGSSIVMGGLTLTDVGGKLTVSDSNGTAPIEISTTDVTEGDNLFYTTARFDSDFGDKSTTDLSEGTRKYYTSERADSDARYSLTGGTGVTYTASTGTISIGQSIGVNDSPTFQGLSVDNLTVHGTQTVVNTQSLTVTDPMITLARNNRANINDIGFFGEYSTDGSTLRHAGLFRDASDNQFHLFEGLTDSPTTYVDTTASGYQLATLNVGTINASNVLDSSHIENMITSLSTDSAAVFLLVDSDYIQARQITYDVANLLNVGGNKIDLDYDEASGRSNSVYLSSLQSAYVFLDNNNSETGNYFGIYNDINPISGTVTEDNAIFKVDEDGKVFSNTLNVNQTQGTAKEIIRATMGNNDFFRIMADDNGNDAGYVEIATADNGNEPIYVRQYSGDFASVTRTLTLLDASGNTTTPGSITTGGSVVPDADSAYDLGSTTKKWRDLHLSGNTIYLGGEKLSADNSTLKLNGRSLFNYSSPNDALIEISDKYVETSTELTSAQAPTDPEVVFNTWNRFSHQGTSQPLANNLDLNAWSYNSSTSSVENSRNTASATGFYSTRKHESYTHTATLKSTGGDDDILGVVIGYVIEDGKHYTLSAVRQTHGNIVATGLMWGLVYNLGQTGHSDATRNQTLLSNGTNLGTAGNGSSSDWSAFTNGTKVYVRKTGSTISIKTSEFGSTTIDDDTEITFDLSSNTKTERFEGAVPYGYIAQSQGPASFSNLDFTPDTPETIIHFQNNGATKFYEYDDSSDTWNVDTSVTLTDKKGKFYHNDKTGRTFFNDGDNVVPIGTVRQFNDVIYQVPQSSAPTATTIGALGLKPGMFAVADGTNWDPASKNGSVPYPVFWDGSTWNALY